MEFFVVKAHHSAFTSLDFKQVFEQAQIGDIIYCDPPYVPLTKSANFTNYCPGKFGLNEQEELRDLALDAIERGIAVLISNHHTSYTTEIYIKAKLKFFSSKRFISCKKRESAPELLALYS